MEKRKVYFLIGGMVLIAFLLMVAVIRSPARESSLTGAFSMVDIAPKSFAYESPGDTSPEAAAKAITVAEKDIAEMKEMNFASIFANDALTEAKTAYQQKDYLRVFKLTQLVGFVKKEKVDFFDKIRLLEIKKQVFEDKGVTNFQKSNELMQQAMNAFTLDQFDEAKVLLDEANKELTKIGKEESRVRMLALLSKNFFVRYWWQSLIGLVLLVAIGFYSTKKIRITRFKNKIARLNLESEKTKELIKKLQRECFVSKTITVRAYREKAEKYEERITEIRQIIPVLEERLLRLKKPRVKTVKPEQKRKKKR